jgi:hypothetical protein
MKIRAMVLAACLSAALPFYLCAQDDSGKTRTVRVCVLNDAQAPVRHSTIESIVRVVSNEYQENGTGLRFKIVERHDIQTDLLHPELAEFDRACAVRDIILGFTNQMHYVLLPGRPKHRDIFGFAEPHTGIVWIYETESRKGADETIVVPSAYQTAKHEIAHLFGVFDPTLKVPEACAGADFMYTWCDTDAWTESLAASIRANRQRTWTQPTAQIQRDLDKQFEYVSHDFAK